MSDSAEIEAKFEADEATLDEMLKLERFGSFRLIERETATQDDAYYDTAGRLLRQAGATLRIRRRESGARMTFKGARQPSGDTHIASRLEDEVDIDASAIAGLTDNMALDPPDEPGPLKRARTLTGDRVLMPTARLLTNRTVLRFEDHAHIQVEVSVDRCEATRLADGRVVRFSEVELELKRGQPDDLLKAAGALQDATPGLRPSLQTKLQRALD